MSLKAKIEAIIYAAEEPITVEQISALVKDLVLAEQAQVAAAEADDTPAEDAPAPEQGELAAEPVSEASEEPTVEAAADSAPEPVGDSALEPVEASAEMTAPATAAKKQKKEVSEDAKIRQYVRKVIEELIADYDNAERGMEIRPVAGGYRMTTRPEHHDVVRAFAKSLKPPVRLSLAALETLAVIAYKQPVTVPEISEIRGVESGGVIGTLLDRKLITTAGRKQVVGRPILYKTTKDFLMRFGLNDVNELPSMEEFEKLASEQADLFETKPDNAAQPSAVASETAPSTETAEASEPVSAEASDATSEEAGSAKS